MRLPVCRHPAEVRHRLRRQAARHTETLTAAPCLCSRSEASHNVRAGPGRAGPVLRRRFTCWRGCGRRRRRCRCRRRGRACRRRRPPAGPSAPPAETPRALLRWTWRGAARRLGSDVWVRGPYAPPAGGEQSRLNRDRGRRRPRRVGDTELGSIPVSAGRQVAYVIVTPLTGTGGAGDRGPTQRRVGLPSAKGPRQAL